MPIARLAQTLHAPQHRYKPAALQQIRPMWLQRALPVKSNDHRQQRQVRHRRSARSQQVLRRQFIRLPTRWQPLRPLGRVAFARHMEGMSVPLPHVSRHVRKWSPNCSKRSAMVAIPAQWKLTADAVKHADAASARAALCAVPHFFRRILAISWRYSLSHLCVYPVCRHLCSR